MDSPVCPHCNDPFPGRLHAPRVEPKIRGLRAGDAVEAKRQSAGWNYADGEPGVVCEQYETNKGRPGWLIAFRGGAVAGFDPCEAHYGLDVPENQKPFENVEELRRRLGDKIAEFAFENVVRFQGDIDADARAEAILKARPPAASRAPSGPVLETPRLVLRPFEAADAGAYASMAGDWETTRWLSHGRLSPEEAWKHMAMLAGHWQFLGFGPWAVQEKSGNGEMIGRVGPWQPPGWPGLELIWTIRPEWRLRGYATESAAAALGWIFENLGLPVARSFVRAENAASVRVARKLGQKLRGGEGVRLPGQSRESLVYAIRKGQWEWRRRQEQENAR